MKFKTICQSPKISWHTVRAALNYSVEHFLPKNTLGWLLNWPALAKRTVQSSPQRSAETYVEWPSGPALVSFLAGQYTRKSQKKNENFSRLTHPVFHWLIGFYKALHWQTDSQVIASWRKLNLRRSMLSRFSWYACNEWRTSFLTRTHESQKSHFRADK